LGAILSAALARRASSRSPERPLPSREPVFYPIGGQLPFQRITTATVTTPRLLNVFLLGGKHGASILPHFGTIMNLE
jgi:hypothetical protein